MTDYNSVGIIGRLTKDAEVKYTKSGTALAAFSISVNRSVNSDGGWKDEAGFFDAKLWGRQAESLKPYLIKGQQVCLSGSLVQERWQGQDGAGRSRVVISADKVQLIGGAKENVTRTAGGYSYE